jgi:predicted pyridoxine 5'-phosphate oxidase superfamily flavin-nucleotide-binding protein
VLKRRIKIWGTAKMVEATPELLSRLMPESYRARPEQIVLFEVEAWDINCPQHIPQRFEADDVARLLAQRDARIAELEALLATSDKT